MMKGINRTSALLRFTAMAALATAMTGTAHGAEDQAAPQAELAPGEIIVTANRTESLLSKTPIAMTAVGGAELTKGGITNPTQLDAVVPNIAITRDNGLQITIRGVSSADNTEKGDPSAAFMLNGIYIARPQAQEVSFFDIERVEVLRGPQGTLYGRNSTAGVVNVLAARPKMQFSGSLEAMYASYDNLNVTGVLNVPVGSNFAVRAAVNVDRRDNFVVDGNPGDGVSIDPFKDNISARLSLLWEPTDALSIYVAGDYSKVKGKTDNSVPPTNFYSNIVTGERATFDAPVFLDRSSRDYRTLTNALAQPTRRNNDDKGIMGEVNYDFGPAVLTYLGSYREFNRREVINYANGLVMAAFPGDYWQTSHELRLALTGDGPLQLQVGGYFFKERSDILLSLYNLLGPNTAFQFLRNPTESENKSAFGQATYEITDGLKLTAGVRYSSDTKSRYGSTAVDRYTSIVNAYNLGQFIDRTTLEVTGAKRTFNKTTWRAGIDYDSPLGLVFASVSTGYKAGGFNDGCEVGTGPGCSQTAEALYYNPETLTAYEAGFKFKFGPQFRLNGTLFHYDYAGLQLTQVINICGPNGDLPCTVTRNAASAKVDGVELEADFRSSDRLSVHLGVNYLDAHYSSFKPTPNIDFSGRPLERSPKWTWTAGADYRLPLGEGSLVASALTRFSSRYEITDKGNYAYFYQPAFTKTDLSLTYEAPENRYSVGVFVRNLENEITVTAATAGFFGNVTFADPRQFGVRAGMKF
ncbi:TonB-dependent receptor [Novosphingobium sp. SL115]|uniref:TonB-dependent receptor n=1 Tax=Novosphingobium sp. SL115 TaxID=2995150 RepID=UPI0022730880|nr:TonB-dependent receptor [Novosphingobium sp. SL115]MCY1672071.1 TonB-dependent receptor [Novosphingobium sp. SL115]